MTNEENLYKIIKTFNHGERLDFSKLFSNDISSPEYVILATYIHIRNTKSTVYVSDIVKQFAISAQAISKHLRSCEKKGYIERIADKMDRRNTVITMTGLGEKVFAKSIDELKVFREHLSQKISREEVMQTLDRVYRLRTLIGDTIEEIKTK